MIHLGDIRKIDGSKIPFVDCITFGSPCQDLSVAGKRGVLMKIHEFRKLIDQIDDAESEYSDKEVTVVVKDYSLGSTPSSVVKSVSVGFDWDMWQIMIHTEDVLYK